MTTIKVQDPNLRTAIEKALNKATDEPINTDEIASLKELNVRESGVRKLDGIEYAQNLTHQRAGGNSISSLKPLEATT